MRLGVFGGVAHTEIEGEADADDLGEPALLEIAIEPGRRLVIVLEEGRIAVDRPVVTFPHDEFGMGNVEIPVKGGTLGILNAMVGPQRLGSIWHLDLREGLLPRMTRGEGG